MPIVCRVAQRFRGQLGKFLRQRRGEMTYAQFARKIGISISSLQRMENGIQNVTLDTLETVARRLKASLRDIFGDV